VWDDVESDLSAFHRVWDPMQLPGSRLIKLAERLPAYDGAVASRLRRLQDEERRRELLEAAPPPAPADSMLQGGLPVRGGGAEQPIAKHSYTEMPEILLPGPQIDGAHVVPANKAALMVSDLGHLFSFGTG
jgi:hypothetical protein